MGHCFGKLPVTTVNGANLIVTTIEADNNCSNRTATSENNTASVSSLIGSTFNFELQRNPTSSSVGQLENSHSNSLTSINTNCPRQIIIKIKLAKMENGNEEENVQDDYVQQSERLENHYNNSSSSDATECIDRNSNQIEQNAQILNVTLNSNLISRELSSSLEAQNDKTKTMSTIVTTAPSQEMSRTAGGSALTAAATKTTTITSTTALNNNFSRNSKEVLNSSYNNKNNMNKSNNECSNISSSSSNSSLVKRVSALQVSSNDDMVRNSMSSLLTAASIELPEYYEVVEEPSTSTQQRLRSTLKSSKTNTCAEEADIKTCSRRKVKTMINSSTPSMKSSKRRCRDALRRILDPSSSSSKSNKSKERKELNRHSNKVELESKKLTSGYLPHQQQKHSLPPTSTMPNTTTTSASNSSSLATTNRSSTMAPIPTTNQVSIWSPNRNDVIIPINSPQVVVVQCPPTSLVTLRRIDENAIRLMTSEIVACTGNTNAASANSVNTIAPQQFNTVVKNATMGPIVHSQIDFVHCLVPDLERITNSSFYWGKMDRYEAERLLEGKQEGTFLLRDSAQEEFLFSVTFRKYGRSLHARIEQSGHKFSFDCHDPCVFASTTVTGLLEHYKDPACVMFFEPMLTHPLHRAQPFSLQQLCRATIVSNTTYDGINELELPARLKSYLKEYHYKQKLRVKPIEPFYSCT